MVSTSTTSSSLLPSTIRLAAQLLARADHFLITCGAGMGADSGLPTFRGKEGFWKAYPPFAKLGLSFVDLANPTWFRDDPELAWGFYGHRYHLYTSNKAKPHDGYAALQRIAGGPARIAQGSAFFFTTNVDGHAIASGWPISAVCETHGSLMHAQCSHPRGCYHAHMPKVCDASTTRFEAVVIDETTMRARSDTLPHCPRGCGSVARPNVLMFGDGDWISDRTELQEAALDAWVYNLIHTRRGNNQNLAVAVIDVGSGTAIPTARRKGEGVVAAVAAMHGPESAALIRINVDEPSIPSNESLGLKKEGGQCVELAMGAREALVSIAAEVDALREKGLCTARKE
jgi:NAD-dependent SIR2 family protein deacetylase